MDKLKNYFATGELRVRAASVISANAATIVKEAVAKSPYSTADVNSSWWKYVHHPSLRSLYS